MCLPMPQPNPPPSVFQQRQIRALCRVLLSRRRPDTAPVLTQQQHSCLIEAVLKSNH